MMPRSLGNHFVPVTRNDRDFFPENDTERAVIAALEARKLQVGLYLFGEAAVHDDADKLNYRALKGPGAVTANTPRPQWYPSRRAGLPEAKDLSGTLSNWATMYPVAQRAMRSFKDGGRGFEVEFQGWTIAARPAVASDDRCVTCHRQSVYPQRLALKKGDAIGGVLYAFRPSPPVTASAPE
jgi:hypothetical protein